MSFKTCGVLALAVLPVLFGCVACGLRPDGRQAAAASLAPDIAKSTSVAATAIPLPIGPQASKVSPPPVTLVMNSTVLPLVPPVGVPPRAPKRTDVDALMGDMHGSLGGTLLPDAPPLTHAALAAARTLMERAHAQPDTLQVVLVVDRSPKVQRLWVTVATPGSAALEPLGGELDRGERVLDLVRDAPGDIRPRGRALRRDKIGDVVQRRDVAASVGGCIG